MISAFLIWLQTNLRIAIRSIILFKTRSRVGSSSINCFLMFIWVVQHEPYGNEGKQLPNPKRNLALAHKPNQQNQQRQRRKKIMREYSLIIKFHSFFFSPENANHKHNDCWIYWLHESGRINWEFVSMFQPRENTACKCRSHVSVVNLHITTYNVFQWLADFSVLTIHCSNNKSSSPQTCRCQLSAHHLNVITNRNDLLCVCNHVIQLNFNDDPG